jgi:hypothetical protein
MSGFRNCSPGLSHSQPVFLQQILASDIHFRGRSRRPTVRVKGLTHLLLCHSQRSLAFFLARDRGQAGI